MESILLIDQRDDGEKEDAYITILLVGNCPHVDYYKTIIMDITNGYYFNSKRKELIYVHVNVIPSSVIRIAFGVIVLRLETI